MPSRTVSDSELLDRLALLFRSRGFDAASLQEIADASGLQKSSLYHRFPAGKQQMATEVVSAVGRQFADDVLAPVLVPKPGRAEVEGVARRLADFYAGGRRACVLEALSIGTAGDDTTTALASAATAWIGAFATVARAAGVPRAAARARAEDAVASIEGALVLARVTDSTAAFERTLKRLPDTLCAPTDR